MALVIRVQLLSDCLAMHICTSRQRLQASHDSGNTVAACHSTGRLADTWLQATYCCHHPERAWALPAKANVEVSIIIQTRDTPQEHTLGISSW